MASPNAFECICLSSGQSPSVFVYIMVSRAGWYMQKLVLNTDNVFDGSVPSDVPALKRKTPYLLFAGICVLVLFFLCVVVMLVVGAMGVNQYERNKDPVLHNSKGPVTDEPGATLGESGSVALLVVGAVFTAAFVLVGMAIARGDGRL